MNIFDSTEDIVWKYNHGFIGFSEAVLGLKKLGHNNKEIDNLICIHA